MAKSIFYDPDRKRWGRLRILFSALGAVISFLVLFFILTVFIQADPLPHVLLPEQKRNLRAIKEIEHRRKTKAKNTHRKTKSPPSQVVLNTDEGIRAAYYVTWDAASFVSLKEYYPQIDILFPEWLHVLTPDGHLQGFDSVNHPFPVVENGVVHSTDDRVMPFLRAEKAEVEVFPLINNYETVSRQWLTNIGDFLMDPDARQTFRKQLLLYLASDRFKGAAIDFEEIPLKAQPGFVALIQELGQDLHSRGLKLFVNVPVSDKDYDYPRLAASSDGLVIMNYDEHQTTSSPGPVASQDWFMANLRQAVKDIPKTKIVCAIGSYGYDWKLSPRNRILSVDTNNVQEAWLHASESSAQIDLRSDSLNPHFAYMEDNGEKHEVWFLDAVTALNEMRAARDLGIRTFALWRLGSEDRSLWKIWDSPTEAGAEQKLTVVPSGEDVDREGDGEILIIQHQPAPGERAITLDPDTKLISSEKMTVLPQPYQIKQYGWKEKKIAITFDDGPDPKYTPKILDILKQEKAPATFFLIGLQTQKFPSLAQRIYDEGHDIGNHTFTHPDISDVSQWYMKRVELQLTEKLFASKLGVKPLYFRPPYSIDQEPDIADQVRPLELVQGEGYITVGSKIDPNDWRKGQSAPEIVAEVMAQAQTEATKGCEVRAPLYCGNIVLLHDGGGDREATVQALPGIIEGLRARGFQIVRVEELLGKTRADVMPRLSPNEVMGARLDGYVFLLGQWLAQFIVFVFFIGDILMSARLLGIGALATYDRLRKPSPVGGPEYKPRVTVIIPAFNEEKVIENTVRSALASDYPNLRTIVVDDGSKDATSAVVEEKFANEIADGRVLLLTKPNAGKAEALNHALKYTKDEIYVGIDADTVIAPNAISILVPHFADPKVGAVAGNAKVGNRVNLWTRWQALEYITSQNFERRALNVFSAVSVVPGAIGAWRVTAVREAGGYHTDTVAEDADLTMSLLENGWRVVNEDRALAFTEAPTNARGLMRQRFRWSFGILQAVWKHGSAIRRRSRLGWIALPNIIVFQIMLPLVSPFIDIMFLFGLLEYVAARYFHPESTDPSSIQRLAFYFVIFLAIDFIASALAFLLERRTEGTGEDAQLLLHLWLQRFSYRQLFSAVLAKTVKRAIDGKPFAWDKLERTAAVSQTHKVRVET
ncbi:MAG TPA: glycosyltransferase [Candidatus Angelobacter sp.]|jgi:cellulose synthase/poly-beta-1,6-N-acetylglucosamine synthase-like glycosyltransferase/peptidoglycan/xylan/chitin deacetylase (PgdA/CDA1 family)/spore germination protein YaaH